MRYAHSLALVSTAAVVHYWRARLTAAWENLSLREKLRRSLASLDLPMETQSTPAILVNLRQAWAGLQKVQKESNQARKA